MRTHAGPVVSFITDTSVDSFARIGRWLGKGFDEIGVPYEAVSIQGPAGVRTEDGVRFVRLGVPRVRRWLSALTRYLRRSGPDLCLVSPAYLVPFAAAAGRLSGRPVVPWEQSFLGLELRIEDVNPRLRVIPSLERLTRRWTPVLAAVSRDVGDHVVREVLRGPLGRDGVFLLPNPVDADEVARLARPADLPRSGLQLCGVGRLVRQKGFDVLIEALAIARPDLGKEWELLVLGEGPQRATLERLIRARGLGERVLLPGAVRNPYPSLVKADVFVHPARWEPFGVALLEALALGVAVVTTDAPGGNREILADGAHGVLVPPEDPDALASAILTLARDPARRRRLAAGGPDRAATFSPPTVAARALELLERLPASSARRSVAWPRGSG